MRLARMLGSAMAAAAVVMALVGAGSAQAEAIHVIGFCQEDKVLCPNGSTIDPTPNRPVSVLLLAKEPKLTGTLNEKCPESMSKVRSSETMKSTLTGELTSLTFGSEGKCSPCPTAKAQGLPYKTTLSMSELLANKFSLVATESIKLENCLGMGITCKFGGTVTYEVKDTASGILTLAEGKTLKLEEGLKSACGESGSLTAMYEAVGEQECDLEEGGVIVEKDRCFITLLEE